MTTKKQQRTHNFSAGPACMPLEVLERIEAELYSYGSSGLGVMEMSHRSKEFTSILCETKQLLIHLLEVPQNYQILFMQGGASAQFSAVPLNITKDTNAVADYVVTGYWSKKAYDESLNFLTNSHKVCDTHVSNYTNIPSQTEWSVNRSAEYLYYCANETIGGVEFDKPPETSVKLIADMSSNFCTKPIDINKHALIFGCGQKNLGPAGTTVVIVREDLLVNPRTYCPSILNYKAMAAKDSLLNTPCCWSIYVMGLMCKYMKERGGMREWDDWNRKKSQLLYDVIDGSDGYYSCPAEKSCRSRMNIPFKLGGGNPELERRFIEEAAKKSLTSLKGHVSVGGCRASLYNGMPLEGVMKLTQFMKEFQEENPLNC